MSVFGRFDRIFFGRNFAGIVVLVVSVIVVEDVRGASTIADDVESLTSAIDAAAAALHKCVRYPGMTVAVIRSTIDESRSQTLIRNYGVRDVGDEKSVANDTRFCIGSVTKTFTAALLAQLLHDNQTYSLDTPVRDLLGADFELCDEERTTMTNVRDLLAHRVGVAKHFGAFLLGYNFTRANIVRRVRHLPAVKPFRSSRIFNNFMYVIAGQLAEKMNGTWWENQIVRKFLNKLKMSKTTFADRVGDWNYDFALPHALDNGEVVPLRAKVTGNVLRPVGPAGSICTTATDMASWILMLLRNGTDSGGHEILTPSVVRELFEVQNPFSKPRSSSTAEDVHFTPKGYGLGWVIGSYRNSTRAFHSGFSNYYYSMVSLLPDHGFGIFTALNGPHLVKCDNGMKALHLYITDLLMGVETPWLNPTNMCLYPRRVKSNRNAGRQTTTTTTTTTLHVPTGLTTDVTEFAESSFDSGITEISTVHDADSVHPTTTAREDELHDLDMSKINLTTGDDFSVTERTTSAAVTSNSTVSTSMSFGRRLRANVRRRVSSRRRRPRPSRDVVDVAKNSKILPFLEPFVGTYSNPFFGDVVVDINLTAPALQFNYGYYGKAFLEPVSTAREPIVFRLHFFSSIWYQSESDDMKLFTKLGMFDVQFGRKRSTSDSAGVGVSDVVDKLVVFLFDTQKPPIFSKVSH